MLSVVTTTQLTAAMNAKLSITQEKQVLLKIGIKSIGEEELQSGTKTQIKSIEESIDNFPQRYVPSLLIQSGYDSYNVQISEGIMSRFRKVNKSDPTNAPDLVPKYKKLLDDIMKLPPGSRVCAVRVDRLFRDKEAAENLIRAIASRDVVLVFTQQDGANKVKLNSRDHPDEIIALAEEAQKQFSKNVHNSLRKRCFEAFTNSGKKTPLFDEDVVNGFTFAKKDRGFNDILKEVMKTNPNVRFPSQKTIKKRLMFDASNRLCDLDYEAHIFKERLPTRRNEMIAEIQKYFSIKKSSNRFWVIFATKVVDYHIEHEKNLLSMLRFHVSQEMGDVCDHIPMPKTINELSVALLKYPGYKKTLDQMIDELKDAEVERRQQLDDELMDE